MASVKEIGKNKYKLYVEFGYDGNGKRLRKTKVIQAKNITAARKELAIFESELLSRGGYVPTNDTTLSNFYPEWLEKHAKRYMSTDTLKSTINIIEARIKPNYGNMKLKDIKKIHIINFIDDLSKNGKRLDGKEGKLAASTIKNCYKAFNNLLQCATDWEIIPVNPATGVKLPSGKSKKSEVYSKEEISDLVTALENVHIKWKIVVLVALFTGARQGEVAALEWEHLDIANNTIYIEQSMSDADGLQIKSTKTGGTRLVSIPQSLTNIMEKYKNQRDHEMDLVGDMREWSDHYFILSNEFGKPIRPDSISQWWNRFLRLEENKHLKKIRFHDLRHTSATLLINEGVHAKVIQERLGHTNIGTTMNIYGHVLKEANQSAASHFDKFIK